MNTHRIIRSAMLAVVAGAGILMAEGSETIEGPGKYEVSSSTDVVLTDQALVVPEGARQFIFNGNLSTEPTVVFRNVAIGDIEPYSVDLGCVELGDDGHRAATALSYFTFPGENGTFQAEYQVLSKNLIAARIEFAQAGEDVTAKIVDVRWAWGTSIAPGDREYPGTKITPAATLFNDVPEGKGVGARRLICRAKETSSFRTAPECIAFRSAVSETSAGLERTVLWNETFTSTEYVTFGRGVNLSLVKSMSAEIGGSSLGSKWQTAWSGNKLEQSDGSVLWQFQGGSGPIYMVELQFRQVGCDVQAKVIRCVYQYGVEQGYTFRLPGPIGTPRTLTDQVNAPDVAIRNIACVCGQASETLESETFTGFITGEPQVIWHDVNLRDVESVFGQMGGGAMGQKYLDAYVCGRVNCDDGNFYCQFQRIRRDDKTLDPIYAVIVRFEQSGRDVTAYAYRCVYQYGTDYGTDMTKTGSPRTLVQAQNVYDVCLNNLKCTYRRHYPDVKFETGAFAARETPIELVGARIVLNPAVEQVSRLDGTVYGRGTLQKKGSGVTILAANVYAEKGYNEAVLDVDAGELLVSGERSVSGTVKLGGGSLAFVAENGTTSSLSAPDFVVASETTIALHVDRATADEPRTLTLIRGSNLSSSDLAKLTLSLRGDGGGSCKGKLQLSEDGDLQAALEPKLGMVVIVW